MMNLLSSHDVPRAITVLGGTPMERRDRNWQRAHNTLTVAQYYRGLAALYAGHADDHDPARNALHLLRR